MAKEAYRQMRGIAVANMILGAMVLVTPWLARGGFAGGPMLWSNVMSGLAVFVLGAMGMGTSRRRATEGIGPAVVSGLIGAWVFVSGFVYSAGGTYRALNLVLGAALAILAVYAVIVAPRPSAPAARRVRA